MNCIFLVKPHECQTCVESRILKCIQNKRHLILSEEGKMMVIEYVTREVSNPERYKTAPGMEQRKGA